PTHTAAAEYNLYLRTHVPTTYRPGRTNTPAARPLPTPLDPAQVTAALPLQALLVSTGVFVQLSQQGKQGVRAGSETAPSQSRQVVPSLTNFLHCDCLLRPTHTHCALTHPPSAIRHPPPPSHIRRPPSIRTPAFLPHRSWLPRASAPLGRPTPLRLKRWALRSAHLPWSPREFAGASETSSIAPGHYCFVVCHHPSGQQRTPCPALQTPHLLLSTVAPSQQAIQRGSVSTRISRSHPNADPPGSASSCEAHRSPTPERSAVLPTRPVCAAVPRTLPASPSVEWSSGPHH
ncbi:hypothetical protein PMIN01_07388, partial [Paraphaeosphaeria minitans]